MSQKIVVKLSTQPPSSSGGSAGGDRWKSSANLVLQKLMKQPAAQPFIGKEDWDIDFKKTNGKGRCLEFIKRDLDKGLIRSADAFVKEVREVFINSLRYYFGPTSMGTRLKAYSVLDQFTTFSIGSAPPLLDPHKRRLELKEKGFCRSVIDDILNSESGELAFYFARHPLFYGEEAVPNYDEHIVEPMWFGRIIEKLESDEYTSPVQMARDIDLLCQNVIDFNQTSYYDPPDLPERARRILELSNLRMSRYCKPYHLIEDEKTARERLQEGGPTVQAIPLDDQPRPISPAPSRLDTVEAAAAAAPSSQGFHNHQPAKPVAPQQRKPVVKLGKKRRRSDEDEDEDEDDQEEDDDEEDNINNRRIDPEPDVLSDSLRKSLVRAIVKIAEKKISLHFRSPVPRNKYPQYYELNPIPMDLGTLKDLLDKEKKNHWRTLKEFWEMGHLIFSNSEKFNAHDPSMLQMCAECRKQFDEEVQACVDKEKQRLQKESSAAKQKKHQSTSVPAPSTKNFTGSSSSSSATKNRSPSLAPEQRHFDALSEELHDLGAGEFSMDIGMIQEEAPVVRISVDHDMKIDDSLKSRLMEVVRVLRDSKESKGIFDRPVEWKKLGWTDYPVLCPHPMDLGTVFQNLAKNRYTKLGALIHDVALIWRNCRAFNKSEEPSLPVLTYAKKLEAQFKQRIEDEVKKYRISRASSMLRSSSPVNSTSSSRPPGTSPQPSPASSPMVVSAAVPPPVTVKVKLELPGSSSNSSGHDGQMQVKRLKVVEEAPTRLEPSAVPPRPASSYSSGTDGVGSAPPPTTTTTQQAQPVLKKLNIKVGARVLVPHQMREINDQTLFKPPMRNDFDLLNESEDLIRTCLYIFCTSDLAKAHFGIPVLQRFYEEDFCTAYRAAVPNPMDLQTMFIKLSKHDYKDPFDGPIGANKDAQMIFKNAIAFNHDNAEIIEITRHLNEFWDDIFEEYFGSIDSRRLRGEKRNVLVFPYIASKGKYQRVLNKVTALRKGDASYFMQPVVWTAFHLSDYPAIIKEPRDLGTISKKAERDDYETYGEFVRDVRLVFSNALLYNTAANPDNKQIRESAERLSQLFESEWNKCSLTLWEAIVRRNMDEAKKKAQLGDQYVEPVLQKRRRGVDNNLLQMIRTDELDDLDIDGEPAVGAGGSTRGKKSKDKTFTTSAHSDEEAVDEGDEDDDEEHSFRGASGKHKRRERKSRAERSGHRRGTITPPPRSGSPKTKESATSNGAIASQAGDEMQIGQYERETENQVQARQELLRKYRTEQRKLKSELIKLQVESFESMVSSARQLAEETAEKLSAIKSARKLAKATALQQQQQRNTSKVDEKNASMGVDGESMQSATISNPLTLPGTVKSKSLKKPSLPLLIFQSSVALPSSNAPSNDILPAPPKPALTLADLGAELKFKDVVDKTRLVYIDLFPMNFVGLESPIVVQVNKARFSDVVIWKVIARELQADEDSTIANEKSMMVIPVERISSGSVTLHAELAIPITPGNKKASFKHHEQSLAKAISSFSRVAKLSGWFFNEDAPCYVSTPRDEVRDEKECQIFAIITLGDVDLRINLGNDELHIKGAAIVEL